MHCNAINKSVWHIKLVPLERASKTDLDPYLSLCENLYFNTNYLPISLQWVVIIEFDCWRQWVRNPNAFSCLILLFLELERPRFARTSRARGRELHFCSRGGILGKNYHWRLHVGSGSYRSCFWRSRSSWRLVDTSLESPWWVESKTML